MTEKPEMRYSPRSCVIAIEKQKPISADVDRKLLPFSGASLMLASGDCVVRKDAIEDFLETEDFSAWLCLKRLSRLARRQSVCGTCFLSEGCESMMEDRVLDTERGVTLPAGWL